MTMPGTAPTARDLLIEARALIAKPAWTQGTGARDADRAHRRRAHAVSGATNTPRASTRDAVLTDAHRDAAARGLDPGHRST